MVRTKIQQRLSHTHTPPLPAPQLVNKMLYRSKQRGWLELDLLVGMWAEQQIPRMDVGMLQSYAAVLEEVGAATATAAASALG
jgi:succinate dehydrogenase flavin-adding protein (antitoxin of CptAB toxin-antitoxin module)